RSRSASAAEPTSTGASARTVGPISMEAGRAVRAGAGGGVAGRTAGRGGGAAGRLQAESGPGSTPCSGFRAPQPLRTSASRTGTRAGSGGAYRNGRIEDRTGGGGAGKEGPMQRIRTRCGESGRRGDFERGGEPVSGRGD